MIARVHNLLFTLDDSMQLLNLLTKDNHVQPTEAIELTITSSFAHSNSVMYLLTFLVFMESVNSDQTVFLLPPHKKSGMLDYCLSGDRGDCSARLKKKPS